MKFKYNFCESKLWRIEGEYAYEISEENRTINFSSIDLGCVFKLGENQYLILGLDQPWTKMIAHYVKTSSSSETIHYEKKIMLGRFQIETIFEFTEQDRLNSS